MLLASLPNLKARAEKFTSGGSIDESTSLAEANWREKVTTPDNPFYQL